MFRNGIIEYVLAEFSWSDGTGEQPPIFTKLLEEEIVTSYRDARETFAELDLVDILYLGVSIFGLRGRAMSLGPRYLRSRLDEMRNDEFTSPEVTIDSDDASSLPSALKISADMMWQAGGLEETPNTKDGVWNPFINR